MAIVVENGIEMPSTIRKGRPKIYPFDEMEVGQSFSCADLIQLKKARNAAYNYKRQRQGWDYAATKYSDGTGRLWRIA